MVIKYYSRKSLCLKGDREQVEVVAKGAEVFANDWFNDTDGVRCVDAYVAGLQLSIPLSYLAKAPSSEQLDGGPRSL